MRSVCVFCGSASGARPEFAEAAEELGRLLGEQGIRLVYGGGQVGLMGIVARSAAEHGAPVLGIIPEVMATEPAVGATIGECIVVKTMHERKRLFEEHAEAFVALPGGLGTLEELFEVACHAQLGVHRKPVGLLDVAGFYSPLLGFLDHTVREGFVRAAHRGIVQAAATPGELLARLRGAAPVAEPRFAPLKWAVGRQPSNLVDPFPEEQHVPTLPPPREDEGENGDQATAGATEEEEQQQQQQRSVAGARRHRPPSAEALGLPAEMDLAPLCATRPGLLSFVPPTASDRADDDNDKTNGSESHRRSRL